MKVLINGITGFVGSHLADYLLIQPDIEIHGLKRWRSPLNNISHILDKVILHDIDLTDFSAVLSIFRDQKFDKVFHLAAQSYVPYSYVNPSATFQTNILGTLNLLEAIRLSGQSLLIHICSSSEVYGQPLNIPIDEQHPLNPISPYGVSKLAEDMLGWQYYKAYGMRIVRTRAFTHTGPRRGEVFAESSFAKQIIRYKKGLQNKIYVGNLDSLRTWCDVRDMVRAYYMIHDGMVGEVYNIGGEKSCTVGDVLKDMLSYEGLFDVVIQQEKSRLRPTDVTHQLPCTEKFYRATSWIPEISLEKTLRDLLDYWRERV